MLCFPLAAGSGGYRHRHELEQPDLATSCAPADGFEEAEAAEPGREEARPSAACTVQSLVWNPLSPEFRWRVCEASRLGFRAVITAGSGVGCAGKPSDRITGKQYITLSTWLCCRLSDLSPTSRAPCPFHRWRLSRQPVSVSSLVKCGAVGTCVA